MLKSEALKIISDKVSQCTLCQEISDYRKENNYLTAPGEGNPDADLMVLGEALGEEEAKQGKPFVGRAGRLLTNILQAAGVSRERIFITNILKCRPPNNRVPTTEEAHNCRKFLDLQIRCIQPKWILCLGKTASIFLLGHSEDTTISSLRGQIYEHNGVKVLCTYHPSYALRAGKAAKEEIWNDLQILVSAIRSQELVV